MPLIVSLRPRRRWRLLTSKTSSGLTVMSSSGDSSGGRVASPAIPRLGGARRGDREVGAPAAVRAARRGGDHGACPTAGGVEDLHARAGGGGAVAEAELAAQRRQRVAPHDRGARPDREPRSRRGIAAGADPQVGELAVEHVPRARRRVAVAVARDPLERDRATGGVAVGLAACGRDRDLPGDGDAVQRQLPADDLGERLHALLGLGHVGERAEAGHAGRHAVVALRLRADDGQVDAAATALEDLAIAVDDEVVARGRSSRCGRCGTGRWRAPSPPSPPARTRSR